MSREQINDLRKRTRTSISPSLSPPLSPAVGASQSNNSPAPSTATAPDSPNTAPVKQPRPQSKPQSDKLQPGEWYYETKSLLDNEFAVAPLAMLALCASAYAADILLTAWDEGDLASPFSQLAVLLRGMPIALCINGVTLVSLVVPWFLAYVLRPRKGVPGGLVTFLYSIYQVLLIALPPLALWVLIPGYSSLVGASVVMQTCVWSMKAHSAFFHRGAPISLRQMADFATFPTLVYHDVFPRTPRIRPLYLLQQLVVGTLTYLLLYFVIVRSLLPIVYAYPVNGFFRSWLRFLLPSYMMFMLGQYGTFHCLLNIFAEVRMYGDRSFYREWWLASSMGEWARYWNTTVQQWIGVLYSTIRHHMGMPRILATFASILLSAVWHDFALFVIFKQVSIWVILFMTLLSVCVTLSRSELGKRISAAGNVGVIMVNAFMFIGFAILMQCMSVCYAYGGAVCLPHHLIGFSLNPPPVIGSNATAAN